VIKVGDKVVCIKDLIYKQEVIACSEYTIKSYTKGKHYEILAVEIYQANVDSYYVSADMTVHDDWNSGLRFSHLRGKIGNLEYFYDYFITIAEWRDKQINSILND
jgi:hypothetical protein